MSGSPATAGGVDMNGVPDARQRSAWSWSIG